MPKAYHFFCNVIFMLIITSVGMANTWGQLSHSPNDSCLVSSPDLLANSSHLSSGPIRLLFLGSLVNLIVHCSSNRTLTTSLSPLCRDLSDSVSCRFIYQVQNLPGILDTFLCLPSISFSYPVCFQIRLYFQMVFNSKGKKMKITSSETREKDFKHSINGNEGGLSTLNYLLHDKIIW